MWNSMRLHSYASLLDVPKPTLAMQHTWKQLNNPIPTQPQLQYLIILQRHSIASERSSTSVNLLSWQIRYYTKIFNRLSANIPWKIHFGTLWTKHIFRRNMLKWFMFYLIHSNTTSLDENVLRKLSIKLLKNYDLSNKISYISYIINEHNFKIWVT